MLCFMKTGLRFPGAIFWGGCASILFAGLINAQNVTTNEAAWQGTVSVVTSNDVTYAEFAWYLYICNGESVVGTGPVVRNGNNFWYNFDLIEITGLPCPQLIEIENTSAALGELAPGIYTLITTSWGVPVATNTFTVLTNSVPPPPSPPTKKVAWQGTASVVTTGNVTYAEYKWFLNLGQGEYIVSTGPVIHNGNNFWYDFDLAERSEGIYPDLILVENTAAALGTLPPGIYTLTTTSWGVPVATNIFTVPTASTPTLQPAGFSADGSFNIQLAGVTNVCYVLQCSTDLVNWTSLSTNLVGPPLSDPSPVWPGPCYYRVQILDTTSILGNQ